MRGKSDLTSDAVYWPSTTLAWLLGQGVMSLINTYFTYVVFSVQASISLHSIFIRKVSGAVTTFFDRTPVGRILTRCVQLVCLFFVTLFA